MKTAKELPVPIGIAKEADRLGAVLCESRIDRIIVVLADGRECWLNRQGEQTGRAPGGRVVAIWDDVPWPMASVSERTRAA